LKSQFGEIGDLRVTVMAGIMIMDELSELKRRLSTFESTSAGASNREEALLTAIMELTEQLNGVTRKLMTKPEAATNKPR
jgi:cell division protein ZapA